MKLLAFALPLVLSPSALAQAPVLEVTSPSVDGLGYTGSFASTVDGIQGTDGAGDFLVGAKQEPWSPGWGKAYLFDGTTGAVVRQYDSPFLDPQGWFGWAVASVPDVNGDAFEDVVIAAYKQDGPLPASGRVYVYRQPDGTPGTELLHTLMSPNAETVGYFGYDVAGLDDVNGDGFGDILVGAPAEDGGAVDAGRAYVIDGATGATLHVLESTAPKVDGGFGTVVDGVPDVDGDGVMDVVVAAINELGPFFEAGGVHVYSGATGASLYHIPCGLCDGLFASEVAGIGDLDGDGRGDLLVATTSGSGKVEIYSGASGAYRATITTPNPSPSGGFGAALADAGDADGDGVHDILIGAFDEIHLGVSGGRAYVFRGADLSLLSALVNPNPNSVLGTPWHANSFGWAVAGVPDANGDGTREYLVGTPGSSAGGSGSGAAYLFFCMSEVEATATVRLGAPPNPAAFHADEAAVIGSTWTPLIDHSSFAPGAVLDLALIATAPANIPSAQGTILVQLTPTPLIASTSPGMELFLPVPDQCTLVGAAVFVQGVSFTGTGFAGANAIDLILGSH